MTVSIETLGQWASMLEAVQIYEGDGFTVRLVAHEIRVAWRNELREADTINLHSDSLDEEEVGS